MNTSKVNTNKPWMSDDYDVPVPENEEMWSQRVIDELSNQIMNELEEDEDVNKKEKN